MNYFHKHFSILIAVSLLATSGLTVSHACTLWSAVGEKVLGHGSILAKNRDYKPEKSELRLVVPDKGYKYLGTFPVEVGRWLGLVAGVNEKGLAIVSATVGSIPKNKRNKGAKRLNEKILTSYNSVDALLADTTMLKKGHPVFYMIADNTKIAAIEVAPGGKIAIDKRNNGTLFHTNHYINENLVASNEKIGTSSLTRLKRIEYLLNNHPSTFSIEDFIQFSTDTFDGPDNSIWRTGIAAGKERTLATWIISVPKQGSPELYIKFANPGQPEFELNMNLDTPFWTEAIE